MHVHDFTFSIGEFSDNYFFEDSGRCTLVMDRVLAAILAADRDLFLDVVRLYTVHLLDNKETKAKLADDGTVTIPPIHLTPTKFMISRCLFLSSYPLDAELHQQVRAVMGECYAAHLAQELKDAEQATEMAVDKTKRRREATQQEKAREGAELERLQKKREGILAIQETLKRLKKE